MTEASKPDTPTRVGLSEGLGLVPEREAFARWMADTHTPALRRMDADGAHAAGFAAGVAAERERWQELADHLRHCRECGETDVRHCHEGAAMWSRVTGTDPGA